MLTPHAAQVLASWDLVFRAGGKLKISLYDVQIHAAETLGAWDVLSGARLMPAPPAQRSRRGGAPGYITCTEVVDSGTQTGRCVRGAACCSTRASVADASCLPCFLRQAGVHEHL